MTGRPVVAVALGALLAAGGLALARADGAEVPRPLFHQPTATLLYQNFPNPFPGTGLAAVNAARAAGSPATCIWFDLGRPTPVKLEVFTLAGHPVRRILPAATLDGILPADRYGRSSDGGDSGCDPRLTWNGTGDDGRLVPPGVYLLRLEADGASQVRKVVFRGR